MEQGKLAKWLKKEGDKVVSGDAIAEIETDKATMEVEAVEEGTIGKIMIPEGTEGVAVNTPIAVLLSEGEDASALSEGGIPSPQPSPTQARLGELAILESPHPQADTVGRGDAVAAVSTGLPLPVGEGRGEGLTAQIRPNGNNRVFASPLARRLAAKANIDLSRIRGSGPHGRIVKRDIDEAALAAPAPQPVALEAIPPQNGVALLPARTSQTPIPDAQILALYEKGSYEIRPLDNMRKTIAARLTQAAATIPHFRLTIDCEIDALLDARQRLNARSPKDGPGAYKLSVNDFLIKAMGLALQRVPEANATFTSQGILIHKGSDIGVAVAIEGGLFTPVVRGVEGKTLAQISNEVKELAERARRRRLAPHEYQGGTTAISNLGMFGIDRFDAVINPPHATILAVGRGEQRPVVKGGQIAIVTMMGCTLSCDHRVVDGALGAQLLAAFKGFVEEPVTMLV
jgi:pyruvate dehydrogenase E2 component (dihydrolipoamide acetyltransferase)